MTAAGPAHPRVRDLRPGQYILVLPEAIHRGPDGRIRVDLMASHFAYGTVVVECRAVAGRRVFDVTIEPDGQVARWHWIAAAERFEPVHSTYRYVHRLHGLRGRRELVAGPGMGREVA